MKIGFDGRAARWYRGTGIGTYTYQLINHFNKLDNINDYLIFMPESYKCDLNFKSNFQIKNIIENYLSSFWDEVNIPAILHEKDISIYHVPQNGVGLPKNKKCPFVITLHDVIPYRMPETVSDRYLKIFSEELPEIISKCDGIITVSNYSKKDIMKAFNLPENKIFVTYLASEDIYKVYDKAMCRKFIKDNYGISDDYILYIGGFSPRKNIVGLIEAFDKLISSYKKEIKLVIAGKWGKSYDIYKNKAVNLNIEDKVLFPGFIPMEHLPYLYNASKLFVYPSFYEGFGLPPIEAMACGTPVIASDKTSVPEIVGNSALLVDPYNVDDMFNKMLSVLENKVLADDLIKKGLEKSNSLSWDNTVLETLTAYKKIINF